MEKKLPYEIHVTVNCDNIDKFKDICQLLDVKPIVLDLMKTDQTVVMQDVMTSSKIQGTLEEAKKESIRIAKELSIAKFDVCRIKIETVPWHPQAPTFENDKSMPSGNYFESHIQVVTDEERKPILTHIAKLTNAHLSRNYFKKINKSEYVIMLTLRDSTVCKEEFELGVEIIKTFLEAKAFEYKKIEIEYAIYDSKQSHDAIWIA
jgi:hypothetical protein